MERKSAHIQRDLRGKRPVTDGNIRIERDLVRQKNGKPVRKIIGRRIFLVLTTRCRLIRVVNKIRLIVGHICIRLSIRKSDHRMPHAGSIHAFFRGIFFIDRKAIDRPIRAERKSQFNGRKDGIIVEIAHRFHLMFIIVSGIRIVERRRHDVIAVPILLNGCDVQYGAFVDHIIGKLARPKPVTVFILRLVEYFERFAVGPCHIAARPRGCVGGSGAAHDDLFVTVKALDGFRRCKSVVADADRRSQINAVFIVFAAVDRLSRRDKKDGRLDFAHRFGMKIFTGRKFADDVGDIFDPRMIAGRGTVVGRGHANAEAAGRRFDIAPLIAAAGKQKAQRYRDRKKDRRRTQNQFFLSQNFCFHISAPRTPGQYFIIFVMIFYDKCIIPVPVGFVNRIRQYFHRETKNRNSVTKNEKISAKNGPFFASLKKQASAHVENAHRRLKIQKILQKSVKFTFLYCRKGIFPPQPQDPPTVRAIHTVQALWSDIRLRPFRPLR